MKLNSGRFWLKTSVFTLLGAAILLLALAALYFVRFDAAAVRHAVEQSFAARGLRAEIAGSIRPQLWGRPGVEIRDLRVYAAGAATPALTLASLRADLAWLPLFAGEHELTRLALTGLHTRLERDADGRLNLEGLLQPQADSPLKNGLDSVSVQDASVSYRDAGDARAYTLDNAELSLSDMRGDAKLQLGGRLNDGKRSLTLRLDAPYRLEGRHLRARALSLDAQFANRRQDAGLLTVRGDLDVDLEQGAVSADRVRLGYRLKQPGLQVDASIPHATLSLARMTVPTLAVEGSLQLAQAEHRFKGSLEALKLTEAGLYADQSRVELVTRRGEHTVTATVSAPVQLVALERLKMAPLVLETRLTTPVLPRGQLAARLQGALDGSVSEGRFNLRAAGRLDGTPLTLTVEQTGLFPPQHKATLALDKLDLNRYLPEPKPEQAVALLQDKTPLKLDWMDFLHLRSKVDIGELNMGRFRVRDVHADVSADGKRFAVDNLSARIYQGTLSGSAELVRDRDVRLTVRQKLDGMHIRPLLTDLFSFSRVDGQGSAEVDIVARGSSLSALRESLTGHSRVRLSQGALTGIDLVAALKNLPAELKDWGQAPFEGNSQQKTTFQSLSASFDLEEGVARNQDLRLHSQLVNVAGSGKVDLKESIIDYALNVKANPRSFERLSKVNVPLKITGQINAPTYALDFNEMVKGKTTPGEKQQALKQELTRQITTILP